MSTNQPIVSSGTPHFFKIILEETLQENKLRIPRKFVVNYGETLSDSVFVKLPCGSKWKMKLTKEDNNVWLDKGWADLAKHYALKGGSMLIFRYEGNSEFNATIFDTSTVEIDYPSRPVDFDKFDIGLELQAHEEEVSEDDSVEILDNFPPCPSAREKSPGPCSHPHKRNRASPTSNTQSNSAGPTNDYVIENSMSKGKLQRSKPEMIGTSDLPAKSDTDECTTKTQKINLSGGVITDESGKPSSHDNIPTKQASVCMSTSWLRTRQRPLTATERDRILERVPFKSEQPFFKVLIQPTNVGSKADSLHIPINFAVKYIKNKGDVVLFVPNGGPWSVKFRMTAPRFKISTARLCKGWREFSDANNLEVGDICIFKLLNGTEISFEVSIVRFTEYAFLEWSQAGDYAAGTSKQKGDVRVIEID